MRLLLDTNILIGLTPRGLAALDPAARQLVENPDNASFASAASLWEIAIKTRLGKLDLGLHPGDFVDFLDGIGVSLLAISHRHVLADVEPAPAKRDPFDRLLLAQCAVEDLLLVTMDRVLSRHPLAWR